MRKMIRLAARKKLASLSAVLYAFSGYRDGGYKTDDFLSYNSFGTQPATWFTPYDSIVVNGKITVVGSGDGYETEIWNSTDGAVWTKVPNTTIWDIRSIAYGNGMYVAMTQDNRLLRSTDAVNWVLSLQISAVPLTGQTANVCFGDGKFIAISFGGDVYTSLDGITWSYVVSKPLGKLSYAGSKWFGTGVVSGFYYRSYDGEHWTNRTKWGTDLTSTNIVYSNGVYVVIRSDGYFYTSSDGDNWKYWGTKLKNPVTKLIIKNNIVAYGAAAGIIVYSLDNGFTWNESPSLPYMTFKTLLLV